MLWYYLDGAVIQCIQDVSLKCLKAGGLGD